VKNWALTGPDPHGAPARPLDRATRCDRKWFFGGGQGRAHRGPAQHLSRRAAGREAFHGARIVGAGDLRVTEFILAYDGRPSYSVSVMEFFDGKVARETQYFADPFEPGPSRARGVERTG
jgi:hypothetical protein